MRFQLSIDQGSGEVRPGGGVPGGVCKRGHGRGPGDAEGGRGDDRQGRGRPSGHHQLLQRRRHHRAPSGTTLTWCWAAKNGQQWAQEVEQGLTGDRKVPSSIPGSSSLSVEVSLSETSHPDCSRRTGSRLLHGRLRRRCGNARVNV